MSQLLAVGPGAWGRARSTEAVTLPDVDSCVGKLDPQLDIGYDRIAARCPDLMRQLQSGAWAAWLPQSWNEAGNDLSAGSLREFGEVVRRETNARVGPHGPDVRRLQPVLQALAGDRRETAWSRFKAWLRSILERRPQSTDEGWLARMVAHVGTSQSVIRLITYASLLAVVVLAGFIIVNEARTAGMLAVRRGAKRKRAQAGASPSHGVMQADLEQAAPADRPRLLLEMILRRLMDLGFLPLAGALTVRELTRIARLPEPDDRSRLAAVALAAERIRYSADESQPASLDESIIQGRELLERLNTSTPG